MIKKLSVIFGASLLLNFVWENLHSYLYFLPSGNEITQARLIRATIFDAIFITLLAILFIKFGYFRERKWYALIFSFITSNLIEIYGLKSGRWAYNELMPVIPVLNTGLTPTVQLGILSYLIFRWRI